MAFPNTTTPSPAEVGLCRRCDTPLDPAHITLPAGFWCPRCWDTGVVSTGADCPDCSHLRKQVAA